MMDLEAEFGQVGAGVSVACVDLRTSDSSVRPCAGNHRVVTCRVAPRGGGGWGGRGRGRDGSGDFYQLHERGTGTASRTGNHCKSVISISNYPVRALRYARIRTRATTSTPPEWQAPRAYNPRSLEARARGPCPHYQRSRRGLLRSRARTQGARA